MTISQGAMQQADYARNKFFISAPDGTDFKSLLKPEYWAHVAQQLRTGDHIEVLAADGAYYAELIVLATGPTWARVMSLNHVVQADSGKAAAMEPDAYYIKWSSPTTKFRVHRTADKEVVADCFETKEMAKNWLDKYQADNYQSAA